jgi:hypothetical protein
MPARFVFVNRQFENRIRELCALAIATRRDDERELILSELQAALHAHAECLKRSAIQKLVSQKDLRSERGAS